jgi:Ca2+-binding RTX toxin-like protein
MERTRRCTVSVTRTLREKGLSRIGVGVGVLWFVVFGSRTDWALAYVYYGDDGPNTFTGSNLDDIFWTYGGNDVVYARDGSDEIHMGSGNDTALGEQGADTIYGGASGTIAYDDLRGGAGGDFVRDTEPSDKEYLCGGGNDDTIDMYDGDGNDWAAGGDGTDQVSRDSGDTWYEGNPTCPP